MKNKKSYGYLTQDIGLVLLLVCFFTGAVAVSYASEDMFYESIFMLLGTGTVILFAGFKFINFSCVVAGFEVLTYTAYRLYLFLSYDIEIPMICYVWIVLPIASVGAMSLFVAGNRKTELENSILREQVEELVMIHPLTKLYNLRSLYNDLNRQIAYAERNKMSMSLMLITLKYEHELASILSRRHYEEVIQRLAQIVADSVRLEDKTYSIDNKGSLAVLLTCDKIGSNNVMRRIRQRISEKNAFTGITDSAIKIEVRIAFLEYDAVLYGNDMIQYKQRVENELQYDV